MEDCRMPSNIQCIDAASCSQEESHNLNKHASDLAPGFGEGGGDLEMVALLLLPPHLELDPYDRYDEGRAAQDALPGLEEDSTSSSVRRGLESGRHLLGRAEKAQHRKGCDGSGLDPLEEIASRAPHLPASRGRMSPQRVRNRHCHRHKKCCGSGRIGSMHLTSSASCPPRGLWSPSPMGSASFEATSVDPLLARMSLISCVVRAVTCSSC